MNYADLFRITLPETTLEVAALVVLIVDLGFLRRVALKARVTIAALLGVAGCGAAVWAVLTVGPNAFKCDGEFLLLSGQYTPAMQIGILVLTALTLLLFIDMDFTQHVSEFVAVVLMSASGGLLIVVARDLLIIFVGLELLSLGLYILTAFAKRSAQSAEAAIKYYLFGGMSAAFLLFGFSYVYGITGSTNLSEIQTSLADLGPSPLLYIAWILIITGLGFKVAAVPFHLWAPDTYEGAPAPAAAFIASVSKIASFGLLLTFSSYWLVPFAIITKMAADVPLIVVSTTEPLYHAEGAFPQLGFILLVVAAGSIIVGNLTALAQISVRRLLAYSAIAHAGYILLGTSIQPNFLGSGSIAAFTDAVFRPAHISANAVVYYVLTYGLTTIGAFGVVSVVERATGSDRLDSFLGLHKRNPLLAAVLGVLFLSLAGIPPLVGFWAKFNLFAAVLGVSAGPVPFALVALAVAMSAVSLYYYLQVLKRAYVMPAIDETPIKAHPVTLAVLVAIAAAVVVLGCFPALLQGWIESFYPIL
jgi:NADH-quinone oxidoreductase subunit N